MAFNNFKNHCHTAACNTEDIYKNSFVDVIVQFHNGRIIPQHIVTKSQTQYKIDKITDVRRSFSQSGGSGIRYTCKIAEKVFYLFYDEWDRVWWFEPCS